MVVIVSVAACSDEVSEIRSLDAEFEQVLEDQADAIRRGDWQELYDMYTPEQQARCPFDEYEQRAEEYFAELRSEDRGAIAAEILNVTRSGDTALVEYLLTQDGAVITQARGDEAAAYARVEDTWRIADQLC